MFKVVLRPWILADGSGSLRGEVEAPDVCIPFAVIDPSIGADPLEVAYFVIGTRVQVDHVEYVYQSSTYANLKFVLQWFILWLIYRKLLYEHFYLYREAIESLLAHS